MEDLDHINYEGTREVESTFRAAEEVGNNDLLGR